MSVPVVYLADAPLDPADLFDLALILAEPGLELRAVCLSESGAAGDSRRTLALLADAARRPVRVEATLGALLDSAEEPLTVIAVGNFVALAEALIAAPERFRQRVARLFLVGGHANDYGAAPTERLPIDPRLRERHPERFAAAGDPRLSPDESAALGRLLACGEAVIWLPRDVCLWRWSAPTMLEEAPGAVVKLLLRELYESCRQAGRDRFAAAATPVLLSSSPALLLALHPDASLHLRRFRAQPARVATHPDGRVASLETHTASPNLYLVSAIDSAALNRWATDRLSGAGR